MLSSRQQETEAFKWISDRLHMHLRNIWETHKKEIRGQVYRQEELVRKQKMIRV